jgi:cyclase
MSTARTRIIPILLLRNESLVKTIQFGKFNYIGDPVNTVRIFNELEVDELMFLDILATKESRKPNLKILRQIANECFMPLCYGGGITSIEQAKLIFDIGFEKIAINSSAYQNPQLITEISRMFGSQAVVVSIDVKTGFWGKRSVRTEAGLLNTKIEPINWAKEVERLGAGEILLTSIEREGTWQGFDLELVKSVSNAVSIPIIANGGCGNIQDIKKVVRYAKASAVGISSMVLYQKKGMGVVINFPDLIRNEINKN